MHEDLQPGERPSYGAENAMPGLGDPTQGLTEQERLNRALLTARRELEHLTTALRLFNQVVTGASERVLAFNTAFEQQGSPAWDALQETAKLLPDEDTPITPEWPPPGHHPEQQ